MCRRCDKSVIGDHAAGKVLVVNGEDGQEDIFANLGWEEVEWLLSTSLTPETTMVDIGSSVVSVVGIF